jgi:hypothetical protein
MHDRRAGNVFRDAHEPTKDPIVPFDGGEVGFFGFLRRGNVRSSRESAQYFADLNHITSTPESSNTDIADGVRIERFLSGGMTPPSRLNLLPFTVADTSSPNPTIVLRASWDRRPVNPTAPQ